MNPYNSEIQPLASAPPQDDSPIYNQQQQQQPHQQQHQHQIQPPTVIYYDPNTVYVQSIVSVQQQQPQQIMHHQQPRQPMAIDARHEFTRRLRERFPARYVATHVCLMLIANIVMLCLVIFFNIQINSNYNTINSMYVSKYVATVSSANIVYALMALITSNLEFFFHIFSSLLFGKFRHINWEYFDRIKLHSNYSNFKGY
jgi:hypothetical protein